MDKRLQYIADNLDNVMIKADEAFRFHCNMCGKCCIDRDDILLNPKDVYNMATELQMEPAEMLKQYCETYIGDSSRIPIMRLKPRGAVKRCPLLKNHKCSVHKAKPTVCAMFPIGRCLKMSEDKKFDTIGLADIQYIYTNPGCGDNSETHTVEEWLNGFGIPLEDEFFIKWHRLVVELGSIFRKGEKLLGEDVMIRVWNLTFVKLYLDYDLSMEFLPQFERNAQELLDIMRAMPVRKGKK